MPYILQKMMTNEQADMNACMYACIHACMYAYAEQSNKILKGERERDDLRMQSEQKLCPHGSIIGALMVSLHS